MKIGLDVRMIESSGIGTTIREFLNHLDESQLRQLVLLAPPNWSNPYPCSTVTVPYSIYSLKQHLFYPQILKKEPFSFFHMPHYDIPFFYGGPLVVTVFDLTHYLYPQFSTKPFSKIYSHILLKKIANQAHRIVVCSENTKKDLVRFFPKSESKIRVLHLGVTRNIRRPSSGAISEILNIYNLKKGYFFYLGNLRPSKNTEGLLKAYSMLYEKKKGDLPPLVLAGKNSLKRNPSDFSKGIRYLGVVRESHLAALYSGSVGFVFPSFYEGFGLPPLEAMACETPVLASDRGSLPEVCGDSVLYVDPNSVEDMASKMGEILENEGKRRELVKRGSKNVKRFSWDSFTKKLWEVYVDVDRNINKTK
ncbi:hypothetical protein BVX98_04120 [bacterium F11]|nr:hypothetical protein BVX98_04120 [bacterium F11]